MALDGLFLVILFFVLLGLIGSIMFIRVSAQNAGGRIAPADPPGFSAADDPAAAQRIAAHFTTRELDRPRATSLRRRTVAGSTIWLCHINGPGENSMRNAVVVESHRLALPRFLLLPRLEDPPDPRLLNMNRQLHTLWLFDDSIWDFPPVRVTGTEHTLSGPKSGWTEAAFSPAFREWLNRTDGLAISGEGRLLVVWPEWPHPVPWGPPLEARAEVNVDRAQQCVDHLATAG
jgi:hypothetical protein